MQTAHLPSRLTTMQRERIGTSLRWYRCEQWVVLIRADFIVLLLSKLHSHFKLRRNRHSSMGTKENYVTIGLSKSHMMVSSQVQHQCKSKYCW